MSLCKHTRWLRLRQSHGGESIEVSDRPHQILDKLRNPDTPVGFALLIGNQMKSVFLSNLCPHVQCADNSRHHGEIHLNVSHARATKPIFLADGDIPLHNRLPIRSKTYHCHESTDVPLSLDKVVTNYVEAADEMYKNFLFPFVDVICLFVSDIGGPNNATQRLATWIASTRTFASPILPALVLIVSKGDKRKMQMIIDDMMRPDESTGLAGYFHHISIIAVSPTTKAAWLRKQVMFLRQRLYQTIESIQGVRKDTGYDLSASHTVDLLQTAAREGCVASNSPLNFIEVARRSNPVPKNFSTHLANFFKAFPESDMLRQLAIPLVASSLIMDQYPPDMHRK